LLNFKILSVLDVFDGAESISTIINKIQTLHLQDFLKLFCPDSDHFLPFKQFLSIQFKWTKAQQGCLNKRINNSRNNVIKSVFLQKNVIKSVFLQSNLHAFSLIVDCQEDNHILSIIGQKLLHLGFFILVSVAQHQRYSGIWGFKKLH